MEALPRIPRAQHRPILVQLACQLDSFTEWRWQRPPQADTSFGAEWTAEQQAEFDVALSAGSVDLAWRRWAVNSGFAVPQVAPAVSLGGFCLGDQRVLINRLFKQMKTLRRRCEAQADEEADELQDRISVLIDAATQSKLNAWIERVRTRGGAARWLKSRLQGPSDPIVCDEPLFTPEAVALKFARDLAVRWNIGVRQLAAPSGFPTTDLF